MIRFFTAGESHGRGVFAFLEGIPAGLKIDIDLINSSLARRQSVYGMSARMKIEKYEAVIVSGLRRGLTNGAPILICIWNKDSREVEVDEAFTPRPGHSDLAGSLKYSVKDSRFISERASARETAARVAAGAICQQFLKEFGIDFFSYVVSIGEVKAKVEIEINTNSDYKELKEKRDSSEIFVIDKDSERKMLEVIDLARRKNDSVGGIFEIRIKNVPPGLGSHIQWDKKLDARLAKAIMSIQAVKGVEIGLGFESSKFFGSKVHDPIILSNGKITRQTNNAGGIEGGMSNGQEIVIRAVMKPISTLLSPLKSVNLETMKEEFAPVERSDICAVPAASVVGEMAASIEIADAFLEKFGGDSLLETKTNFTNYVKNLKIL